MRTKKRLATPAPVTEQRVRLVAAFAGADARTVRKYLEGGEVRGAALRERLEKAVKQADAAKDIDPERGAS